jgi:hypothetical protein
MQDPSDKNNLVVEQFHFWYWKKWKKILPNCKAVSTFDETAFNLLTL